MEPIPTALEKRGQFQSQFVKAKVVPPVSKCPFIYIPIYGSGALCYSSVPNWGNMPFG